MKRFILYFLFLHLFLPQLQAQQQQDWQWGKRGGSANTSLTAAEHEIIGMVTDQNNNVYVLGTHLTGYNLPDVDGHLGITGNDQLILASWDCAGNFRWMKSFGTANSLFPHLDNGYVRGSDLAIDSLGGVYVIGGANRGQNNGCYQYFDNDSIIDYRLINTWFLLKYDTSGNFQWLKRPMVDTVNNSFGTHINAAPNGDLYVYAYLAPGVYENGAFVINEVIGKYMYVIKYDKDGIFKKIIHLDIFASRDLDPNHPFYTGPHAIGSKFFRDHQTGKFYLTGRFNHTHPTIGKNILKFGNTEIFHNGRNGNLAMGAALYLSAFDSTGNALWAKQSDTLSTRVQNPLIDIDFDGNIYLSARIDPEDSWDGYSFNNSLSNAIVPFILKIDENDRLIWGTHASIIGGGPGGAMVLSGDTVALGNTCGVRLEWDNFVLNTPVVGISNIPNFYLARFNTSDGSVIDIDAVQLAESEGYAIEHLTSNSKGDFYMAGGFVSWLAFAGDTLRSHRGRNWFVLKFGYEHCDCEIPEPDFTADKINNLIYRFDFTGIPADADSIVWDWGDGTHTTITDGSSGWNASHTYSQEGLYEVCVTVHNACAIQTYCKEIKIERITNIDGLNAFPDLQFYPNPASQDLYLDKIPEGVTLDIYNTLGQHVLHRPLPAGKSVIDVSKLASGVYILEFKTEDGRKGNGRLVVGEW